MTQILVIIFLFNVNYTTHILNVNKNPHYKVITVLYFNYTNKTIFLKY